MKPTIFTRLSFLAIALASLSILTPAIAAEPVSLDKTQPKIQLDKIQRLLANRQYQQALPQLQEFLTKHAQDMRGQFMLGTTFGEMGKDDEAITVFTKLTEDFPEVPEPYNNLGALYARRGDLEQARQSLEMAIRANPNYAIAQENLGDVYARLAAAQYRIAERLNATNKPLVQKRTTLETVIETAPQVYNPPKINPNSSTSSVPF